MESLEHTRARTLAEVAKRFQVSKVAVWKWKDKNWIVYDDEGLIDIAATAAMVDANRDAFVGGKPDRGIEPKPNLSDQLRPATASTAKSKGQTRTRIAKQRRGNEHLPEDIQSPVVCERWPRQRQIALAPNEGAAAAVGEISSGMELFGFTKGQFSAPELLHTILMQTGPADVTIGTWTINTESAARLAELQKQGEILSIRLVLDKSLRGREPEYCQHLIQLIGNENIRTTRNHAKWMTVSNDTWKIAVRTSMNFGSDPRLEFFEVSDDPVFVDFFATICDELWKRPAAFNFEGDGSGLQFDADLLAKWSTDTIDPAMRRLSITEAADHFSVSRSSITRARNAGWLTFDDDGCAPVERLDAEWTRHHGSAVSVQPLVTDPTCEDPGVADPGFVPYAEARRRREVAEAEIAEIKARTMAGELISREAAEAAFVAVATAVRTGIEGVVGAVADQLVGMSTPAEVRAVLRPALERALSELSEAPNVD